MNGRKTVVDFLIMNGANVNSEDRIHQTPLHLATEKNHMEVVELLIAKKARVNSVDIHGRTPLHYAAKNGNLQIVKILVNNGAFLTIKDYQNQTPCQIASNVLYNSYNKAVDDYLKEVEEKLRRGHQ
ncbi:integrin-linked protein kinase-like [Sitodiplosis mosellana]|uniref:integrin-linked protein kinase-like n=1 Tax=Sitodiplosis mosellana TaxID=263140 RepID=UPI00244383EC|nr:integrin-linked protein kinase-like [Sitodiplosis mosellana]